MPEVSVNIGGRSFDVACQEGEEHFLQTAAAMLNTEAEALTKMVGRMPEARMLLMAGLMLADKTAGLEDKVREADARVAQLQVDVENLKNQPTPEPQRVEVPVVPQAVTDAMAELAARAEAVAASIEEKTEA